MTNLSDYIGAKPSRVKLDMTFRYNDKIADLSSKFIEQIPNQIKKKIKSLTSVENPKTTIHYFQDLSTNAIIKTIEHIIEENDCNNEDLLILARYNHNLPDGSEKKTIKELWPGDVNFMSCHKAKGLESHFTLVVDLASDNLGFPSIVETDPILEMVLPKESYYLHSEERRLFYVALTRAKEQNHLLTTLLNPSSFTNEIENLKDLVQTKIWHHIDDYPCPECKSGNLLIDNRENLVCENSPLCKYAAIKCPKCWKGHILVTPIPEKGNKAFSCKCTHNDCNHTPDKCPICLSGVLTIRKGKYGEFESCSNYFNTGCNGKPRNIIGV